MKKVLIALVAGLAALGAAVSIIAARFEPTIVPNTYVGIVGVGGLTKDEAAKKIRIWWEAARTNPLSLSSPMFAKPLPPMTPGQLGITIDDQASVAELPMTDLVQAISESVGGKAERKTFEPKFKTIAASLEGLKKKIAAAVGKNRPARVTYEKGAVVRHPEVSGFTLDDAALADAVIAGLSSQKVAIPMKEAPKLIPDADLAKIVDVESEFSTRFPSYQTSRNTNIRLASAKLNGCILMPGEEISFNGTVGRRTVKGGFREAPVLKNGKHDIDIGGGICQVSTTLYNAALLADLQIVRRNNHSIPSVYVALGRDATVDYGNLDLVFKNSEDHPIAVSSTYQSGKITFRILGKKDLARKVKIVTNNERSWGRGEQLVVDRSLKPGTRRVIERGSGGRAIDTYRVVLKDGVEVKRELISHSNYSGMVRLVAYNPAAPKPPAPTTQPTPPVLTPPVGAGG